MKLYKAKLKDFGRVHYIVADSEEEAFNKLKVTNNVFSFEPLKKSDVKYLILFRETVII